MFESARCRLRDDGDAGQTERLPACVPSAIFPSFPPRRSSTALSDRHAPHSSPSHATEFIKLHFTAVQAACAPGSSAADVMRELGVRYRAEKAAAAAAAVAAVGSREVVEGLATGLGGLALA